MNRSQIVASRGRLFARFLPVGLLALMSACGGGATAPGGNGGGTGGGGNLAVSTVSVSPTTATLLVGVSDSASLGTTTATATPKDASGNSLSGRTITWASTASSVATVSSTGVITAVAPGTANITATSEGQIGTAVITVTRPAVATLVIAPAPPTLLVGVADSANLSVATFTATPKDAAGHQLVGRTIAWSSASSSVAAVNAAGTVTALSPGTASINASSEGQTGSVSVTVTRPPAATVTIAPASAALLVGVVDSTHLGMTTFTVAEKDAAGHVLTGRVPAWASSASGVATVTSAGLVDAVSPGSAGITATVDGVVATAAVTVTRPNVAQVVITPQTSSIKVNASETLTLTLLDAQNNQLTGSGRFAVASNNSPGIITVNGPTITGVAAGTGTATYTVDGVSAGATITVNP